MIEVAFGKFDQNTRAGDHASAVDALVDEGEKMFSLVIAELNAVGQCDSWQSSLQMVLSTIVYKNTKDNSTENLNGL